MIFFMPGLTTLMATGFPPSAKSAEYTWAIDAAAIGLLSKLEKVSSIKAPISFSISAVAWTVGKGGRLSCKDLSISVIS